MGMMPKRDEASPVQRLENVPLRQAKVDHLKVETPIGHVIVRAFQLAGLSIKEVAALVNRDASQVAKWTRDEENPQLRALFAVEQLRQPLAQALAEAAGCEVETTFKLRRTG